MYNFKTKNEAVYIGNDIELLADRHVTKLVSEFEECVMKGSGWYFIRVSGLEVRVNKHRPLHGGGYIPLPNKLKHKKSIINILNRDEFCFKYCILAPFVNSDRFKT